MCVCVTRRLSSILFVSIHRVHCLTRPHTPSPLSHPLSQVMLNQSQSSVFFSLSLPCTGLLFPLPSLMQVGQHAWCVYVCVCVCVYDHCLPPCVCQLSLIYTHHSLSLLHRLADSVLMPCGLTTARLHPLLFSSNAIHHSRCTCA